MKRVVLVVALAALSLIAFAGPVAAHGVPLPDAACNQGTERAFWVLEASLAVPMDGTDFDEPWCMTMPEFARP